MNLTLVDVLEQGEEYTVVDHGEESKLRSDFAKEGEPAQWADNFPKTWGSEKKKIDYKAVGFNIEAASVSHDEKFLAVAVGKGVQLYDTNDFATVASIDGTMDIKRVLFQPKERDDGYVVVTHHVNYRSSTYVVILWHLDKDGKRPQVLRSLQGQQLAAERVAVSVTDFLKNYEGWKPGDPTLESVEQSVTSHILETVRMNQTKRLLGKDESINGTLATFDRSVFSNDGKRLVYLKQTVAPHHRIVVHDIESGKDILDMDAHIDSIMSVAYSPDDQLMASAAWDQELYVWNPQSGKRFMTFPKSGGQNWVCTFSPDSRYLVVSAGSPRRQRSLIMYDIHDSQAFPKILGDFPGWARTVQWSPDGTLLAAGSLGGKMMVFKPHANAVEQVWESDSRGYREIADVTWMQDGRKLAFKSGEGGLEMYDLEKNLKWSWGPGPKDSWRMGSWFGTIVELKKKGWIGSIDQDGALRFWETPE